jgi:cytidylate kinase
MADLVITIDGPAASGKSTVAQRLAKKLGASFLDTGAMYRAVTLAAMQAGVDMSDENKLLKVMQINDFQFSAKEDRMAVYIDGTDVTEQIRQPQVTANAHHIAAKSSLRAELVRMQRQFAAEHKKIVTEGRDQGTVAFQDADIKFYLKADLWERARRRQAELKDKGNAESLEQVQKSIEERDKSDENRSVGPLKPAHDAIVIDTTNLSLEEVVEKVLCCVEDRRRKTEDRRQRMEDGRQKTDTLSSVHCPLTSIVWYWLSRWACRVFCVFWFRIRVYGRENVPDKGAFILASNHQSYLDPIFCGVALKRRLSFVARESLFSNPERDALRHKFFTCLIYSLNAIPVKRGHADGPGHSANVSSVKEIISRLKQGRGVCLFPEATRTIDGKINDFKPGLGLLCRRSDAAIVPVLLDGAFECWPRHKKIFSPGWVTVCYGEVITAEQAKDFGDEKLAKVLTDKLRQMQKQCRLRQGKQPHNYGFLMK